MIRIRLKIPFVNRVYLKHQGYRVGSLRCHLYNCLSIWLPLDIQPFSISSSCGQSSKVWLTFVLLQCSECVKNYWTKLNMFSNKNGWLSIISLLCYLFHICHLFTFDFGEYFFCLKLFLFFFNYYLLIRWYFIVHVILCWSLFCFYYHIIIINVTYNYF